MIKKYYKHRCDLCNSSKFRILIDVRGDVMTSDRKIINTELKKIECIKCGLVCSVIPNNKSLVSNRYEKSYSYNLSNGGDTFFFNIDGFLDRSSYVFDWILSVLTKKELESFKTIIEVGCGQGKLLSRFVQKFPDKKIIGLEINEDAIKIGRKSGLDIRKFDENSDIRADLVISFAVIEHTLSPKKFLHTLSKFLTPDGIIVIGQPHQNKIYYDVFFFDHLYHFSTRHIRDLGNSLNLIEIRRSFGSEPIDTFSMHVFKKSTRRLKPKIKFAKTKVADSIRYYNTIFEKVNEFLRESRRNKITVFGLGEIFSLLYTYTRLRKSIIELGIDDFPNKEMDLNFPVISSNEIHTRDIRKMLICVNPHYYEIVNKKIELKCYDVLFPFIEKKSIIQKC